MPTLFRTPTTFSQVSEVISTVSVTALYGSSASGAWVSSMGIASVAARFQVDPLVWVLGTALAMDAGFGLGVGLNFLDVEHLGWKFVYVTAISAGTTLVVALPGLLLAAAINFAEPPDILLASSVLGAGIGLLTMNLIDFRIAPEIPLWEPGMTAKLPEIQVRPSMVALPQVAGVEGGPQMVFGLEGTF